MSVNIIRINGKTIFDYSKEVEVAKELMERTREEVVKLKVDKAFKKIFIPSGVFLSALTAAQSTLAAAGDTASKSLADKLMPLIELVQDLALPVGIVIASWGLIEIMIGNPNGKAKVKMAIIGFVGMFIIPFVFYAIRDAFQGAI